jgi:hypothetical protein
MTAWKTERAAIARDIAAVLAQGQALLRELGTTGDALRVPGAPVSRGRGGRPRGYKTSAATRAKLRAAWARRKAALAAAAQGAAGTSAAQTTSKRTRKGRRTMSPEARARIAAGQRKRWAVRKKAEARS